MLQGETKNDLQLLLRKYLRGTATQQERDFVDAYYDQFNKGNGETVTLSLDEKTALGKKLLDQITTARQVVPISRVARNFLSWWKLAAAALLLVMLSLSGYFAFRQTEAIVQPITERYLNDIPPGNRQAVLTLANGLQIQLDTASTKMLGLQSNVQVQQVKGGMLVYTPPANVPGDIVFNQVTTPVGGQYRLMLPDGSMVWLNAASSIRFPTIFIGKERRVSITGEAYFEVTKNAAMPFVVTVNNQAGNGGEVSVLGTHFNINAYDDELMVRTTLLEGSVKLTLGPMNRMISPGQQGRMTWGRQIQVGDDADIEETIAWKNGRFTFKGASIKTIMNQLSRWYGIEIIYEKDIDDRFVANISEDLPISKVLQLLEGTGEVHFKIEGRRVTVLP